MQFKSKVYGNLERKRNVRLIFLDLPKAFDILNRNLIDKLHNTGVRRTPLKLFESYLTQETVCML